MINFQSLRIKMLYFRLTLALFIVGKFVGSQELLPFPTPFAELSRIQAECEKEGIPRIKETKIDARRCLTSARAISSDSSDIPNTVEMMMTETECENVSKHNECWTAVIQKINSCLPGRGDIVGNIYKALSTTVCRNNGKIRSSIKEDELCKAVYHTAECGNTEDSLSTDLCRSFKAQRACEKSALANCKNERQKELIFKDLDEVEKSLKCAGSFMRPTWILAPTVLLTYIRY